MATERNRQESRNRTQARNRPGPEKALALREKALAPGKRASWLSGKKRWLSGKKRWLSGAGTGIAAGLLMGLTYVGIGYMVLTAVFPVVMVTAEWWMGRGTDPREGGQ